MTLKLPDGAIMTPMTKSGKIVGFSAVGPDGKAQDVMHMKIQMKKMPRGTPKKAKKPPVKQPVEPVCWYCRCTDISCVCVPTPCQDKK
jgi:hypothetical protein